MNSHDWWAEPRQTLYEDGPRRGLKRVSMGSYVVTAPRGTQGKDGCTGRSASEPSARTSSQSRPQPPRSTINSQACPLLRLPARTSFFDTYTPPCPRISLVMSSSHEAGRAPLSSARTCPTGPPRTVLRCRPDLNLRGVAGDAGWVPSREGGAGHRVEIDIGSHVCSKPVGIGPGSLPCGRARRRPLVPRRQLPA